MTTRKHREACRANGERIWRANNALASGYVDGAEDDVTDLLTDRMHYCHWNELDFQTFYERAHMAFDAEKNNGQPTAR